MSRLDELIAELCPDGVEYLPLKKVAEFRSGWTFPKGEQGTSEGVYPFYKVADMNNSFMYMKKADNYISEETAKKLKCKPAPKGTIIFPKVGATMGTNKKRILTTASCYDNNIMGLIANGIEQSYLYYLISRITLLDFANGTGAVPSLDKNRMENYLVPVPPIEVQKEIVRILDNFTNLTAELTAELTARQKQYEFYRDTLLTFDVHGGGTSGVQWKTLGEIGKIEKGKNKDKKCSLAYSITKGGLVPTVEYFKDIKITSDDTSGYRIVKKNWFVYSPSRIDVGSINYLHDDIEVIVSPLNVVFSINENIALPSYLLYFLRSRNGSWQILTSREGIEGTGRKLLPFDKFSKIKVPVPSIEIQVEIVKCLDKFLEYNSILELELTNRQKQYEYYRDKLLTFKEK